MATDVVVWEIDLRHRLWARLVPDLADVVLPKAAAPPAPDGTLPIWLRHLFWNADLRQLDIERHAAYIAGRVLASEDAQAHAWAAATLPRQAFLEVAALRGVPPDRAALARNLAGAT